MNNKQKNYFNLALVWFEEFIRSSRRVFSSSICVIFQIILSLILFISLHSLGLANKTYRVNDKFPLFFYSDRFTLYMLVRSARTLSTSPNVAAPYLIGKQHAAPHYTTSRNDPLQYQCKVFSFSLLTFHPRVLLVIWVARFWGRQIRFMGKIKN